MKSAVAKAVLLAAWAMAAPCWSQAPPAVLGARVSPAIQIGQLRAQVEQLKGENEALKAKLAGLTKKSPSEARYPDAPRQIADLTQRNEALQTGLTEARNALAQREAELEATKTRLDEALAMATNLEATLADLRKRVDADKAIIDEQGRSILDLKKVIEKQTDTIADRDRTIARQQDDIDRAGPPLWPWGGLAAVVALFVGTAVGRTLLSKPKLVTVSQPLSVSVKLGEWLPRGTPTGLGLTPSFSVKAELAPQFSSIHASREPLVREVRDAPRGAAQ